MKFAISDYVVGPTTHANLGFQARVGERVPIVVKYIPRCLFLSFYLSVFLCPCSPAQVVPHVVGTSLMAQNHRRRLHGAQGARAPPQYLCPGAHAVYEPSTNYVRK